MSLNYSVTEHSLLPESTCKYHPFKEESQILSFCEYSEIKENRQKTLKSLEKGQCLQVIYGEKGIGKTMFSRNLSLSRRLNAQIIKGANGLTVVNLIKRLCSTIQAPLGSLTSPPMKHINLFVEHFCKQEKPLCIMIDDAHLLPIQTLAAIVHCNNKILQEGRNDFTVALLGTPDLKDKITPLVSDEDKLSTNYVELGRLKEESIIHYIYTKLRHAGWRGTLPVISSQELKNIKTKSGGIPKNINHIVTYNYYDNWINSQGSERNMIGFKNSESQKMGALSATFLLLLASSIWAIQSNQAFEMYVNASNVIVQKIVSIV